VSKRNDSKRTKRPISEAIQATNRRRHGNAGYVAFYPDRPGILIPDETLRIIMDGARRGLMTEAGKKLILVPDTRYNRANDAGMQSMQSVSKKNCVTLGELYRG